MTETADEATVPAELTPRLWLEALRRSDTAALLALYATDAVLHSDEGDHDSPGAIVDHLKALAPSASASSGVDELDPSVARAWWSTGAGRELHVNMRVAESSIVEQWIVEHEDFEHPDLHRRHSRPKM